MNAVKIVLVEHLYYNLYLKQYIDPVLYVF